MHLGVLPTCVNPLPTHSKGCPGLDEVIGDGAAIISTAAPGQLGCAVCHLLHRHRVGRARGAWPNHRNRHREVLAHAKAQQRLQYSDATACLLQRKREQQRRLLNNIDERDCYM